MKDKKVIIWSEDSIGYFDPLFIKNMYGDVYLRDDAVGFFDVFHESGYRNVVVSPHNDNKITQVLLNHGLDYPRCIVMGKDDLFVERPRGIDFDRFLDYNKVAYRFSMSHEEAIRNMVVISSGYGYKPVDFDGLVCVHYMDFKSCKSEVIKTILDRLESEGDNDFNKGFKKLYENSDSERISDPMEFLIGKYGKEVVESGRIMFLGDMTPERYGIVQFENGLIIEMGWDTNLPPITVGEKTVPFIRVTEVPDELKIQPRKIIF
jgi:hypothetical protein